MTINVNPLDSRSIEAAIKQIEEYEKSFDAKCKLLLDRLVNEVGAKVVKENLGGEGDSDKNITVRPETIESTPGSIVVELRARGRHIAFIEFGAGITFNGEVGSAAYPRAKELGFTIGSYSDFAGTGYSQGQFEYWWYNGKRSYGTESTAPVYKAAEAMRQEVARIAIEVFGKEGS